MYNIRTSIFYIDNGEMKLLVSPSRLSRFSTGSNSSCTQIINYGDVKHHNLIMSDNIIFGRKCLLNIFIFISFYP